MKLLIKYYRNIPRSKRYITSYSYEGDLSNGILSFDIYSKNNDSDKNATKLTAVFLHGILGSKRNWRTPAQTWLQINLPYSSCITIDHRGHGKSTKGYSLPNTISSCANDLDKTLHYIETNNKLEKAHPNILFAHSFGGKVALRYLEKRWKQNKSCPNHVWILDSMPGLYKEEPNDKQSVLQVMNLLSSLPNQYDTRESMINQLIGLGIEKGVALWLGTNLIPVKIDERTVYQWGFQLDVITDLFHNFSNESIWEFLDEYNNNNKTNSIIHFLRAGKNLAWTDDVINRLNKYSNQNIRFHTMDGVGHWLHAENLRGLFNIIKKESGYN